MLARARRWLPGKERFVGPVASGWRRGKASHCSWGCSRAEEPSEDRKHEGTQRDWNTSLWGGGCSLISGSHLAPKCNKFLKWIIFSLKIEHAPPTSSLNKSLAPVLFSSRSPGSAAFSEACQYFCTWGRRPEGCDHRRCLMSLPIQRHIWAKPGAFQTRVWLSVTGLHAYSGWNRVTKLS